MHLMLQSLLILHNLKSLPKCLIIIFGQTRAWEVTWISFKSQLLDILQCDLALCVGIHAEEISNPFYKHAKYIWTYNDIPTNNMTEQEYWTRNYDQLYDAIVPPNSNHNRTMWKYLLRVTGNWMAPMNGDEHGGGIALFYRQFLYQKLTENDSYVYNQYEYFMQTRSDYIYQCQFPKNIIFDAFNNKKQDFILFTDSKHYGGVQDRNLITTHKHFLNTIDIVRNVFVNYSLWERIVFKKRKVMNIESAVKYNLILKGIWKYALFYKPVMFTVRSNKTDTIRNGKSNCFNHEYKVYLKHCGEDVDITRICNEKDENYASPQQGIWKLH